MKNLAAVLIYAVFLLNSLCLFAETKQDKFVPVYGKVLANNVNIRAGQGPNFEAIGRLNKGAQVVVIAEGYNWYKIRLPKQARCFVHKNYIEDNQVTVNRLRVRAGKGTNFNVLGTLRKGAAVEILKEEGNWLRISPPEGCSGWIKKNYLELSKKKFVREIFKSLFLPQTKIEAKGVIDDLGKIFNRQGTHKLVDGKKVLYYLKSESIDLNRYVYQKVRIKGRLLELKDSPYPVIAVEQIQAE